MRHLSLPGWLLTLSTTAFLCTWILAPQETFSGIASLSSIHLPPIGKPSEPPILELKHDLKTLHSIEPLEVLYGMGGDWQVALTFDDGPHPIHTKHLLEILERYDVKATFFVNGYWLADRYAFSAKNRAVLRLAYDQGHTIGNHTYSHALLSRLSPEQQRREIMVNHELIRKLTGEAPTLFRPPYAVITPYAREILREHGYSEARWNSTAPDQTIQDPRAIRDIVMGWLRAYRGGIVMLHDRHKWSVDAVRLLLATLRHENCQRFRQARPTFQVVSLDSFLMPPSQSWSLHDQKGAELRRHREHLRQRCGLL